MICWSSSFANVVAGTEHQVVAGQVANLWTRQQSRSNLKLTEGTTKFPSASIPYNLLSPAEPPLLTARRLLRQEAFGNNLQKPPSTRVRLPPLAIHLVVTVFFYFDVLHITFRLNCKKILSILILIIVSSFHL